MELHEPIKKPVEETLPDKLMNWIGSVASLIVHTIFFVASFVLAFFGVPLDKILLVVTTVVSLEAIYMAIFIQMAINRNTQSLEVVEDNIDEIQEDVEFIEKDIDEIQGDIDEIQEDVDEIEKDDADDENHNKQNKVVLEKIDAQLQMLMAEIDKIKHPHKPQ